MSDDGDLPLLRPWITLLKELPALLSDRVELLALELQRVGRALAQIVALVVATTVLGVTVWLLLWAAVVGLLLQAGWPLALALLPALAFNGLAIVFALQRIRRLLPLLGLPATRRHLTLRPPLPPEPPAAPAHEPAAEAAAS